MVDMTIKDNGSLAITETIDVQFSEPRHGIERLLPQRYSYDDTRDEIVDYSDITSNVTKSTYTEWSDLVLRLWDADRYVDGSQQYVISYTASPWVKQYSWWQELYWNLIGTEWWVPIRQVTFRVATPAGMDLTTFGTGEISVVRWSSWTSGSVKFLVAKNGVVGQTKDLSINEWVTVGIKFDDGVFVSLAPVSYVDNTSTNVDQWYNDNSDDSDSGGWFWWIINNWWIWVFGWVWLYNKYRNKKKTDDAWPIVTQYYPPEWVTPAIAWYIDNDQFDGSDFMATLYDWWAQWYISIEEQVESWIISNTTHIIYHKKITPTTLAPYEQTIWSMMFTESDSFDFDNLDKGWFSDHGKWFFTTIMKTITTEGQTYYESAWGITWWMWSKKLTTQWSAIYAHLCGYRDFIEHVEKDKLQEFINQDALFVDKVLPWAVVFWLHTGLVAKLEWLTRSQPTWYIGSHFTANTFGTIMNNSGKQLAQAADLWQSESKAWFNIALGVLSIVAGGWRWGGWGRSW